MDRLSHPRSDQMLSADRREGLRYCILQPINV
jgi:hypothetical protein